MCIQMLSALNFYGLQQNLAESCPTFGCLSLALTKSLFLTSHMQHIRGIARLVLPATTLEVALQTESNGFYFSCSPNMQSKFNYMLSNPLCYIFFHLLVLDEIHTLYVQRLLVSVHCPWKHLWLILP